MYRRIKYSILCVLLFVYGMFCVFDLLISPITSDIISVTLIEGDKRQELIKTENGNYIVPYAGAKIVVDFSITRHKKGVFVANRYLIDQLNNNIIHLSGPVYRHINTDDDLISKHVIVDYTLPSYLRPGCQFRLISLSYYYNRWNIIHLINKQDYTSAAIPLCIKSEILNTEKHH